MSPLVVRLRRTRRSAPAQAPGLPAGFHQTGASSAPDFVVTSNGQVIPVPSNATGPIPAQNGQGFRYTGGSGGKGLAPTTTDVRIMDPTLPKGNSPGYPNGYTSYSNSSGQTVAPYTGKTVAPGDPEWHVPL